MSVDGFRYGSCRPVDPDDVPDHGPGCPGGDGCANVPEEADDE